MVASIVSLRIIDGFEFIQIDMQDRYSLIWRQLRGEFFQPLGQATPVKQTRKMVCACVSLQLCFVVFMLRDINPQTDTTTIGGLSFNDAKPLAAGQFLLNRGPHLLVRGEAFF